MYKPKEHLYYSKNKLFEAPGISRITSQNKMVLILLETFLHFLDYIFTFSFTTKVVLTLIENLLHKGHCVDIDNWCISIEICDVLNNNTTNGISTLRQDCKSLPDAFVKNELKQGETVAQYELEMGLAVTHWKDKRDFFLITTCIPDFKSVVQIRGVETALRNVIHTYDNMMGGVDRSEPNYYFLFY